MHDLTGPELPLTQEFLAEMMGVRRTSVTDVARNAACECNDDVRSHYRRIFSSNEGGDGEEA